MATATVSLARTAGKNTFVVRISITLFLRLCLSSSDFRAVATYEKTVHDHRTGRKCAVCGGVLHDSIVNFGDFLPAEPLELARQHAKQADLCLVLGSSLTVPPACGIPEITGRRKGAKLAICNLQKTSLDKLSDVRVFSKTDDLMVLVMDKLNIPIPPFILRRRLTVDFETGAGNPQLKISGVDEDGTPATFLQSIKLEGNRRVLRTEPFIFSFRDIRDTLDSGMDFKIELEFMGHYGEPNLEIFYQRRDVQTLYLLEYDPATGEWTSTKEGDPGPGHDARNVIDLTDDTMLSNELSGIAV
jgi:Sir2 family